METDTTSRLSAYQDMNATLEGLRQTQTQTAQTQGAVVPDTQSSKGHGPDGGPEMAVRDVSGIDTADVPYLSSDHWTGELEGLWTEADAQSADTQKPLRYEDHLRNYLEETAGSDPGTSSGSVSGERAAPVDVREAAPKPREQIISELAPKITRPGITPGRAMITAEQTYADAEKRFGSNAQTVLEMLQPGQDPRRFLDGFQNAYILGKQGNHAALDRSSAVTYLNQDQRLTAYEMGTQAIHDTGNGIYRVGPDTGGVRGKGDAERRSLLLHKVDASGIFVNKMERLYRFAQKVKPVEGYTDFVCHADPNGFYIDMVGAGNDTDMISYSPEEFAEMIRNSKKYIGGPVRILSCQAGARENGAAYRLACALNVEVLAPTEIVNVDEDGNIFLSDNDILAEIWYNATDKGMIKETGKWREFVPKKGAKK